MILNRYVFLLILTMLMSFGAFYFVITKLDPFLDRTIALSLFFVSLFFSVSSISALFGYSLRIFFYGDELFLNHFNISLRQGILLGLWVSMVIGLQSLRTLTWWNGLLLIFICILIEVYFVAKE